MAKSAPFDEQATEYDGWFDDNRAVYLSELEAVRALLPPHAKPLEVGVGTGRFAQPLGIALGVEPSLAMRRIAEGRGIRTVEGVAEDLPFGDGAFDLVLMVTTLCFVDDADQSLREAHRVLSPGGHVVVGFLDRATELGRKYEQRRAKSEFYRLARFFSAEEVLAALAHAGFCDLRAVQTVFGGAAGSEEGAEPVVRPGHGAGLFVVVRGRRHAGVGGTGFAP